MKPGDQVDRYRLIEPLGQGGQASVWKAEDLLTHELRAVKLVSTRGSSQADLERARREGRTLASLRHPSLCRCHAIFEDVRRSVLGVVLELVDGTSLAHVLGDPRLTLPLRELLLGHVALALEHLHANGLVHRDVKPANVLVANDFWADPREPSNVRLADLGIAVATRGARLTGPGAFIGTPRYMAPEQLDLRHVSIEPLPATDIFAFGLLALEVLEARHPCGLPRDAGFADYASAYRGAATSGNWPPGLPDGPWQPLLARCIALQPADRYRDGRDLVAAIAQRNNVRIAGYAGPTERASRPYTHERRQQIEPTQEDSSGVPGSRSSSISVRNALLAVATLLPIGLGATLLAQEHADERHSRLAELAMVELAAPKSKAPPIEDAARISAVVVPVCGHPHAPLRDAAGFQSNIIAQLRPGLDVELGARTDTPPRGDGKFPDPWFEVALTPGGPVAGWLHADLVHATSAAQPRVECGRCPDANEACKATCRRTTWTGTYRFSEGCGSAVPGGFNHGQAIRLRILDGNADRTKHAAELDIDGYQVSGRLAGVGEEGKCGRELVIRFQHYRRGDLMGSGYVEGDVLLTLEREGARTRTKWARVAPWCSPGADLEKEP